MKTKTPFAVIAIGLLASCGGIGGNVDPADLPVRDGPQSQAPFSLVAPAPTAVVVTDA